VIPGADVVRTSLFNVMTHCFLAAASLMDTGRDIALTFGVNKAQLIAQIVSFLIVAGALYKWAYTPVLNVLEERRQKIAEGLSNAEKIKQELARTEVMRQEIMQKANSEANRLIEEARAAAAKVQESETQKAIAAAEDLIAKAREATSLDRDRMMKELRKEIGKLVVQATAQVTGKILTMDDQKRLIEETTRQLAA
jgi:F-type H+-transporting ATPase subunit b